MRRYGLSIALAAVMTTGPAIAQEGGAIPNPPPLVARYATPEGRLRIGGGPEAALVAAALEDRLTARITGPTGTVPMLTQGIILLAALPRELTPIESAAVRRFAGSVPLSLPVMKGLFLHIRRDTDGAIDMRALPIDYGYGRRHIGQKRLE